MLGYKFPLGRLTPQADTPLPTASWDTHPKAQLQTGIKIANDADGKQSKLKNESFKDFGSAKEEVVGLNKHTPELSRSQ